MFAPDSPGGIRTAVQVLMLSSLNVLNSTEPTR